MLKTEQVTAIATLLKIKPEDLAAAIKDEKEVEVTIPEVEVFTKEEVTTIKNNEYKSGKEKGLEMAVKDTKEKLKLDFAGKTLDGLIEAATKKALEDAKIEPTKQVADLTEKLKTVQQTAAELQTKLQEKEGEVSTIKTESAIIKEMPANTTLPQNKILLLMKADGYDYKNENGKIVWYKDGHPATDKLGSNLDTKTITSSYLTENKLLAGDGGGDDMGGRGGGDGKGAATFTKLSELKKSYESLGKSVQGQEFMQAVEKAVKDNPEFKMSE